MKLWLIKIGEAWPTDEADPRLSRTGVMAQQYARAGDDVIWISDVFDHNNKKQRFDRATSVTPEPGLTIVGLHGPGYPRNVCLQRFAHHRAVAEDFKAKAATLPQPDVIVTSAIPLELLVESVRYGKAHNIPVVVDVRDMWPDAWLDVIPAPLRPVGKLLMRRYVGMLREAMRDATALCGLTQDALDWGLAYAGRSQQPQDRVLPLAYAPPVMLSAAVAEAERFWTALGIGEIPDRTNICFFGTFTKRVDFNTVIKAAQQMEPQMRRKVRFVFCGTGELDSYLRSATANLDCFVFSGWTNATQLAILTRRAQIGLLPYPSDPDFRRSLPNKVFDYLNGGMPILTCLKGNVQRLVETYQCGWMYENDSPDSLNTVLQRVTADPSLIAVAAECARAAAVDFDADKLYDDFRKHLATLAVPL